MDQEFIKNKYKDVIIKTYFEKGLKRVPEICVLYSIPLILGYEIISEKTLNEEDKAECLFKINYLTRFYKGQ